MQKNNLRPLLSLIMIFLLSCSLLSVSSFAADGSLEQIPDQMIENSIEDSTEELPQEQKENLSLPKEDEESSTYDDMTIDFEIVSGI